jgi:hypothetical protein
MKESRIQLVARWRLEGRTEEATRYRDQVREQLRAQGKTRKEAREESWQAAQAAFPPLPPTEDRPELPPVARAPETSTHSDSERDWVFEWFNCVPSLAKWQRAYGVTLSDEGLRELLRLVGFGSAWAFMLGARGDRPPDSGDRRLAHTAALIENTFEEMATLIDVNQFKELVEANDANRVHDLRPAEPVETPQPSQ